MAKIAQALRSLVAWLASRRLMLASPQPIAETVAAYCPECGGQSLLRDLTTERVFCPQCK